jgi:hypothetical protein
MAGYLRRGETAYHGVAGHRILGVEHIGSTAVVGLGAKPIVDIMAGVNGPSGADELLPLLREIGYEDVTRELGDSERYYCLGKVIHGEDVWLRARLTVRAILTLRLSPSLPWLLKPTGNYVSEIFYRLKRKDLLKESKYSYDGDSKPKSNLPLKRALIEKWFPPPEET